MAGGTYHTNNVDGDLPNPSQAAVNSTPGAALPGASPAIATTQAPPPSPIPPPSSETMSSSSDTVAAPKNFDDVEMVDDSLQGKLSVTRTGSSRTTNDLLSVFAGLRNKTSHVLKIEAQTVYKDAQGTPLPGGSSSWVPITLKSHGRTDYRSASLSADAQDYLIRIRRPPTAAPAPAPSP